MHIDYEEGQPAKTRYRIVDRVAKKAAWLELEPLTGRTHQLRAHCEGIGHPIIGDGKYGGQDAFLTGSISRKMHLHARRLIIDSPDGEKIDAVAPLPEHFAASLEQLGFDEGASDASPYVGPAGPPKSAKKQVARQHAKQVRKAKRGERRTRGKSNAAGLKGPARKGAKTGSGKPGSGKPGSGKPGTGKPGSGKSGPRGSGKPVARR